MGTSQQACVVGQYFVNFGQLLVHLYPKLPPFLESPGPFLGRERTANLNYHQSAVPGTAAQVHKSICIFM